LTPEELQAWRDLEASMDETVLEDDTILKKYSSKQFSPYPSGVPNTGNIPYDTTPCRWYDLTTISIDTTAVTPQKAYSPTKTNFKFIEATPNNIIGFVDAVVKNTDKQEQNTLNVDIEKQ
jgi:hypothetical protein